MGKIIEYKVVYSWALGMFEGQVNALLDEGWEPFGGVDHDSSGYSQAMVIREQPVPAKKAKVNAAGA